MTSTNRLPAPVRAKLEAAMDAATMPRARCAIASEHQEAMRLYLESWVVERIGEVLAWDEGKVSAAQLGRYI
jgi:hypothetical protein